MKTLLCTLFTMLLLLGCSTAETQNKNLSKNFDHTFTEYGALLSTYVSDGLVDYKGLKANRTGLDKLVIIIETADLSKFSEAQKLAFYINAYNIITLVSIVDAYPIESIKDIDGVWDKKKWPVARRKLSLNQIEHEILRVDFSEPRIHFTIVCASIGCPPLAGKPYIADALDKQLNDASANFALNANYNRLDPASGKAELSAIFDWFGDDFIEKFYVADAHKGFSKKENSAINFIIGYHPADQKQALQNAKYKISYIDYDWSLNEL